MQHSLWKMYSRIQNGLLANKKIVVYPKNLLCLEVLKVLYKEGYVNGFRINPQNKKIVDIFLKYSNGKPAFLKMVSPSKPGSRLYVSVTTLWKVKTSMVTFIISTPKGVYSDKDCRRFGLGGEVIGLIS